MQLKDFDIEEIDGCEFVNSSVIGKMMISHHFVDGYTGKIHFVYPDGTHIANEPAEAQRKLDNGEWVVIR